jgi:hypothetical protein
MPKKEDCGIIINNLEGSKNIFLNINKENDFFEVSTEKGNIGFLERKPLSENNKMFDFITNLGTFAGRKIKGSKILGLYSAIKLENQTILKMEQGPLEWNPKCIDMKGNEYVLKEHKMTTVLEIYDSDEEILSIKQHSRLKSDRFDIYLKPNLKITNEIVGMLYILITKYLMSVYFQARSGPGAA